MNIFRCRPVLLTAVLILVAILPLTASAAPALPAPVGCNVSAGTCYTPVPGDRWQWQLQCSAGAANCTRILNGSEEIRFYDIDWEESTARTVREIHASGAKAVAYMSAGTWENWRHDRGKYPAGVIGKTYPEWPQEKWLDVRRTGILVPIMVRRMKIAKKKGFDGVQFDNLDGWQTKTGFPLSASDYAFYAAKLANRAHRLGLSASWENAAELRGTLLPYMDWFLMEDCAVFGECSAAGTFISAGKFVGGVEYTDETTTLDFCTLYRSYGISGMLKKRNLGVYRLACPD